MNSLAEYSLILQSLICYYDVVPGLTSNKGQLFLRHDIDVDLELAREMAVVESKHNVEAVYFIRMRGEYYNPLNPDMMSVIQDISALGHTISIHFDDSIYTYPMKGFIEEKKIFHQYFPGACDLISLHRPMNIEIDLGVTHTYSPLYGKEAKYFSDANCLWRYGYPERQVDKRSVHLLTHPIWWVVPGKNEAGKCKEYVKINAKKTDEKLKRMLRSYV